MSIIKLPYKYNLRNSVIEITSRLPKDEILSYAYIDNVFYFAKNENLFWVKQIDERTLETNSKDEALDLLNLNKDYREFFRILEKVDYLKNIYRKIGFITLPKTTNYFEIFVKVIIEQQISYKTAVKIQNNLIKIYGQRKKSNGKTYYIFPEASRLINEDLKSLGISKRKEEYIKNICEKILNGKLILKDLKNKSRKEIFELLLPLKGIGKWSIEHIMLRGYGRYDFLPSQDLFFKRLKNTLPFNLDFDSSIFLKWKGLIGYYLLVFFNYFCKDEKQS